MPMGLAVIGADETRNNSRCYPISNLGIAVKPAFILVSGQRFA